MSDVLTPARLTILLVSLVVFGAVTSAGLFWRGRMGLSRQKMRERLAGGVALTLILVFVYGLVRFPDQPIHRCPGASDLYCGKQFRIHSADDFEAYETWNTVLLTAWPLGMIALALLYGLRLRR